MKTSRWRTSIAFHLEVVQVHNRSDAQDPLERFCPDSNQGFKYGLRVQEVGLVITRMRVAGGRFRRQISFGWHFSYFRFLGYCFLSPLNPQNETVKMVDFRLREPNGSDVSLVAIFVRPWILLDEL
jgi:hypothetical protein